MAGQVLVRRSSPCAATPAGERLLRLARQTSLLYDEAAEALDAAAPRTGRACRSRSTPTRSTPGSAAVLRAVGAGTAWRCGCTSRTRPTPPTCCAAARCWLRSRPTRSPVQGCAVEPLGTLRYRAGRGAGVRGALAARARLRLGADADRGVQREGRAAARRPRRPRRRAAAGRAPGADLGRLPRGGPARPRLGGDPRAAAATPTSRPGGWSLLSPRDHVDVPLHWQRWRLDSPLLARLTDAVRAPPPGKHADPSLTLRRVSD